MAPGAAGVRDPRAPRRTFESRGGWVKLPQFGTPDTDKEVSTMLVPLLILAGLFLWATGHLILR